MPNVSFVGKLRILLTLMTVFLCGALLSACSSSKKYTQGNTLATLPTTTTWETLVEEVDSLDAPEGVSDELFSDIKEKLLQELQKRISGISTRNVSISPSGRNSKVTDLQAVVEGNGWRLTWSYQNQGDGNEDGFVNIQDITPLAVNFFKNDSDPEGELADYNDDRIVNIQDISALAENFLAQVADYTLEFSYDDGNSWLEVSRVAFQDRQVHGGRDTFYITYDLGLGEEIPDYARVVPRDALETPGIASDRVPLETPLRKPDIISVRPTLGISGQEVIFEQTVTGTRPMTFSWDFGGGATPDSSAEESPLVTLADPGTYSASVTASNALGDDTFEFLLEVLPVPEAPDVTDVNPKEGLENSNTTFTATLTGGEPITFTWNFGGGATPNVEQTEVPSVQVTLGRPGIYSASVTATNAGGSDTFNFELNVTEQPQPPTILSITPTDATSGLTVNFTAEVVGTPPFNYDWNFNGCAWPQTTTDTSPRVRLGKPGNYTVSLTVTNDYGTDSRDFPVVLGQPILVDPWENITFISVTGGLGRLTFVTNAGDNSGRLFILEQIGRIRIYKDGGLLSEPFLDITDRVGSQFNEQGLLGLAFHPNYPTNGRFFVNYTDVLGNTVVSEFLVSGDPDRADPLSERVILTINQPFSNHNGGMIAFGPDEYLYIATGDGGSGGDPHDNGQNLLSLLGKILRIDVDSAEPYGIPPSNPFAGNPNARPEIWAYGLRNPWRFSFDRETGDLWIADVGQRDWEEVNFQPADSLGGENYGWRILEGFADFNVPPTGIPPDLAMPMLVYSHSLGDCSITGGYVYRGSSIPSLIGTYLFADYCTGRISGVRRVDEFHYEMAEFDNPEFLISTFGEGEDGELYYTDHQRGSVYRIIEF